MRYKCPECGGSIIAPADQPDAASVAPSAADQDVDQLARTAVVELVRRGEHQLALQLTRAIGLDLDQWEAELEQRVPRE